MSRTLVIWTVIVVLALCVNAHGSESLTLGSTDSGAWQGWAVAVGGDVAVVTCLRDDEASFAGSATVYRKDAITGTWSQEVVLSAIGGVAGDQYGASAAIDGDTVVIGASGGDGSAYVYDYDLGTGMWSQTTVLTSGGSTGAAMGSSVAIDGGLIAAGAPHANDIQGEVHVFENSAGSWTAQTTLTASDAAAGSGFGCSVSLSGDDLAVGAMEDDGAATNAGAVYVFGHTAGLWVQSAKLTASDADRGDALGWSVCIDGDRLIAGAPFADGGARDAGAAYVFDRTALLWSQDTLVTPSVATPGGQFGRSVCVVGDLAAVGSPSVKLPGGSALYCFEFTAGSWDETDRHTVTESKWPIGFSVDLTGTSAVSTAATEDAEGALSASIEIVPADE